MTGPPLKIQSSGEVTCQPRFSQNDIQESYNKEQSLGSQNMTNMFCRIIQDLISIASLTGLLYNSSSGDSLAKMGYDICKCKAINKANVL